MDKPTKPTNLMPRSFGGVKNNFSASLQSSGYEDGVPAIYGGDNVNYQLDATGKELDYCETICDFINALPVGKTITTDTNNKLIYKDLSDEVNIATTSSVGIVKPDGTTITIDDNGTITAETSNFAYKSLSNLTDAGRILGSEFAMPSDVYDELALGADGTQYTAPANGWFCFAKYGNGVGQYVMLRNVITSPTVEDRLSSVCHSSGTNQALRVYMPAKKNDAVRIQYTANGNTIYLRFVYAKGSESEAS